MKVTKAKCQIRFGSLTWLQTGAVVGRPRGSIRYLSDPSPLRGFIGIASAQVACDDGVNRSLGNVLQVWKFAMKLGTGEHRIEMPKGSKLLTVQLQAGVPVLWAICDDKAIRVARKIWSYGTGDAMLRAWPYVATLQTGPDVLHYFDFGEA